MGTYCLLMISTLTRTLNIIYICRHMSYSFKQQINVYNTILLWFPLCKHWRWESFFYTECWKPLAVDDRLLLCSSHICRFYRRSGNAQSQVLWHISRYSCVLGICRRPELCINLEYEHRKVVRHVRTGSIMHVHTNYFKITRNCFDCAYKKNTPFLGYLYVGPVFLLILFAIMSIGRWSLAKVFSCSLYIEKVHYISWSDSTPHVIS